MLKASQVDLDKTKSLQEYMTTQLSRPHSMYQKQAQIHPKLTTQLYKVEQLAPSLQTAYTKATDVQDTGLCSQMLDSKLVKSRSQPCLGSRMSEYLGAQNNVLTQIQDKVSKPGHNDVTIRAARKSESRLLPVATSLSLTHDPTTLIEVRKIVKQINKPPTLPKPQEKVRVPKPSKQKKRAALKGSIVSSVVGGGSFGG